MTSRGRLVGSLVVAGALSCSSGEPRSPSPALDFTRPARTNAVASAPSPPPTTPRPAPAASLDPTSLAVLKEALAGRDPITRLIAVEALGDARAPELVDWIGHALGDPEHDVRVAAVDALAPLVGGARARALLISVRDDKTEDLEIRALAASALLRPNP